MLFQFAGRNIAPKPENFVAASDQFDSERQSHVSTAYDERAQRVDLTSKPAANANTNLGRRMAFFA